MSSGTFNAIVQDLIVPACDHPPVRLKDREGMAFLQDTSHPVDKSCSRNVYLGNPLSCPVNPLISKLLCLLCISPPSHCSPCFFVHRYPINLQPAQTTPTLTSTIARKQHQQTWVPTASAISRHPTTTAPGQTMTIRRARNAPSTSTTEKHTCYSSQPRPTKRPSRTT